MKKIQLNNTNGEEEKLPLQEIFSFDIRPYTSVFTYEPGERICKEGEKPAYLFYLFQGRTKLYLSHDNGKISLVNFLSAPCFIGEMELLDKNKGSDEVKAVTACQCYAIKIDECREELLCDAKFLRYLCRFLSRKAIGNTSNYTRNQSYPLKSRLATFILESMEKGWYREPHTETAEYLGVTYRHLLYVMADLVKEGVLEKRKSGYRVVDMEKLQDIAKG